MLLLILEYVVGGAGMHYLYHLYREIIFLISELICFFGHREKKLGCRRYFSVLLRHLGILWYTPLLSLKFGTEAHNLIGFEIVQNGTFP